MLGDKLQVYIKCLNDFSSDINGSRSSYLEEIDREKGPGKKTRIHANNLKMFSDPGECIDGLRKGVDTNPDLVELETAGVAYAKALEELKEPMAQAYAYLDSEDFKDDKWAKGQELHPILLAGFDAFAAASGALDGEVATINGELQERRLITLEKQGGRTMPFLIANNNLRAKTLVGLSAVDKVEDLKLEPISRRTKRKPMQSSR
jgi:hypothetical protein